MSDELTRWQEGNDHYLAAALAWLRHRLARLAGQARPELDRGPALVGVIGVDGSPGGRIPDFEKTPANGRYSAESDPEAAEAMRSAAAAMSPPPALHLLGRRLGLSCFEQQILLLCAAMDLDTRIADLCAAAQGNAQQRYPTFALAMALFDDPAWDALSPERPLRYWRLLEIDQPGGRPLTASALRADERILGYLKGLNYLDDRLGPLLVPFDVPAAAPHPPLPASQQAVVERLVNHLRAAGADRPPLIQLVGPDPLSQQLVALEAAAALGSLAYRLPMELLPTQPAELETLTRLWQRESLLLPLALFLDTHEGDAPASADGDPGRLAALRRVLARRPGLIFLAGRDVQPGLAGFSLTLEVDRPTVAEQRQAWGQVLSGLPDKAPARLAAQFNLNTPTIGQITRQAADEALPVASEEAEDLGGRVWIACLAHTRPRLSQLAQRLELKATWADLVLPDEELRSLRQIAAQVGRRSQVYDEWGFRRKMNRGLGISALFAGESGTGKTMAAEVLANALGLDLYRIDLSAVVSKYIGETEKNLRRLFDAAEAGGAVLFFDEADALFGKRSEVKDSHDRYANIEINYLLQRLETYRGLAILATNMKSALDHAFLRRLRFVVNFPYPSPAERKAIWQRVFPAQTPTAGLDFDRLARLNLTGGSIHNIALAAAFLAADAKAPVTMPLVLQAARTELRKLERPINEAELRWPS